MLLFKNQNIPNKTRNGQISLLPQVFFNIILEILADAMRYKKQNNLVLLTKNVHLENLESLLISMLFLVFLSKNTQ